VIAGSRSKPCSISNAPTASNPITSNALLGRPVGLDVGSRSKLETIPLIVLSGYSRMQGLRGH
jgi:hypothetical protein